MKKTNQAIKGLLSLNLILIAFIVLAQETIKGTIKNDSGDPLPDETLASTGTAQAGTRFYIFF